MVTDNNMWMHVIFGYIDNLRAMGFWGKQISASKFDGKQFSVSDMGRKKYSESTLCLKKSCFG